MIEMFPASCLCQVPIFYSSRRNDSREVENAYMDV